MSTPDHEPLAIDEFVPEWKRKITVDRELDDMIVVDPYEVHAPSRRSDKELGRVLSILDELEGRNP